MTTGKKYQYRGYGPGDRAAVLRKEIDLIDLEVHGHREMVTKLRYLQDMVMLTHQQAREVADEVKWRQATLRHFCEIRRTKVLSIQQWTKRLNDARKRTTEARP